MIGDFYPRRAGMNIKISDWRLMMRNIRAAIVGVGNCASSLVQGIEYYKDAKEGDLIPGLMHVKVGPYHIRDIDIVCAFDITKTLRRIC